MVKLVHPCLRDHLASLYSISYSHSMVDTVLVCRDGKLYQNRLVVQLVLRLLDLQNECDSDMMVILPEYSVEEIEFRIQQLFGIRDTQDEVGSQTFQENDGIEPVDDLNGNFNVEDSYGIPEMLAKLTGDNLHASSQSDILPPMAHSSNNTMDLDLRSIQTPDLLDKLPDDLVKSIEKPATKARQNVSKSKKSKSVKESVQQEKGEQVSDMTKPYKPVKMVYKGRPKNLVCPQCPYRTYHVSNLTNHMRTHTGEKPFSCQHCGESFRFSGVRNLHERTHTGEKEYSCQYCGKEFARRYVCLLHERTHTGEKPFGCDYCGKRFTRHSTKVNHEKSHVGDPGVNFAGILDENQGSDIYIDLV
eukprot:GFUD01031658.1.p1 GENE.GFUD01031658.1~~GFUD01031658.1.p1  ORF type:complete len:360 (+),score=80.03 GFUD01031658.1:46-1125(+)